MPDVSILVLAVLTVVGAIGVVAWRSSTAWTARLIGVAAVGIAAALAINLGQVDPYYSDPDRLIWHNQPSAGWRAAVVVALAALAGVGVAVLVLACRRTWRTRGLQILLVLTSMLVGVATTLAMAHGAH